LEKSLRTVLLSVNAILRLQRLPKLITLKVIQDSKNHPMCELSFKNGFSRSAGKNPGLCEAGFHRIRRNSFHLLSNHVIRNIKAVSYMHGTIVGKGGQW
jgi:hypothetical protein